MTPVPIPTPAHDPGSLTVPLWFGWEHVAALVVLGVVVGVAALVALAAGRARSGRAEFQAWLDARSARRWEDQHGSGPEPWTVERSDEAATRP
jgi:hypothetical protein